MAGNAVLGLGGAIDWEITWSAKTLSRLAAKFKIEASEIGRASSLCSERDLILSILSHLRAGTGGEYFTDTNVISAFASHFTYKKTLGGTGVRAALAMNTLGLPSTVHIGATNQDFERLLPPNIATIYGVRNDHSEPHLIVQFPANTVVQLGATELVAPAANRLIYTGDLANRRLQISDQLSQALAEASVFLISGFNSMRDKQQMLERADELKTAMQDLPASAIVIYEDAGYHVPKLSSVVRDYLADRIDIYSLNEDELAAHLGRPVHLLDPSDLSSALEQMHSMININLMVLHTKHFGVALGVDAAGLRSALSNGILLSSARYAFGDHLTLNDYERLDQTFRRRRDATTAIDALERRLGQRVAGVASFNLAEIASPTTIGLGDYFIGGFIASLSGIQPSVVPDA